MCQRLFQRFLLLLAALMAFIKVIVVGAALLLAAVILLAPAYREYCGSKAGRPCYTAAQMNAVLVQVNIAVEDSRKYQAEAETQRIQCFKLATDFNEMSNAKADAEIEAEIAKDRLKLCEEECRFLEEQEDRLFCLRKVAGLLASRHDVLEAHVAYLEKFIACNRLPVPANPADALPTPSIEACN